MINVRTYLLSIPYNAFHENRSVAGRHFLERVHMQSKSCLFPSVLENSDNSSVTGYSTPTDEDSSEEESPQHCMSDDFEQQYCPSISGQ